MFKHRFLFIILIAVALLLPHQLAFAQSPSVAGGNERSRGIALYGQGNNYKAAAAALNSAVKKDKTDFQAWYFLGLAQVRLEKLKDATKSLENAVRLQPDFSAAHLALGYIALLRNKHDEAVRKARLVLAKEPGSAEAHHVIGVVSLRQNYREEALKESEIAIKLSPQFGPAYLLKSQAQVSFVSFAPVAGQIESTEEMQRRFIEAAGALERFLQLEPNAKNKETWMAQLESLRFHATPADKRSEAEQVYSGKQVTSKARVTAKPEPQYTAQARNQQTTGTVVLRCVFAADRTVKYLLVVVGLPDGLTEMALEAARRIKFEPAIKDGRPVSTYIQLEYNFNLY
jgi:TonB family protein